LSWSITALAGRRDNYQAHPLNGPLLEQLRLK
jgi:hypothetical protein